MKIAEVVCQILRIPNIIAKTASSQDRSSISSDWAVASTGLCAAQRHQTTGLWNRFWLVLRKASSRLSNLKALTHCDLSGLVHGLTVATRNTWDFAKAGVGIVNL